MRLPAETVHHDSLPLASEPSPPKLKPSQREGGEGDQMRLIRLVLVSVAFGALALGIAGPAHAAKPCNQYPTVIQPLTCKILEKLP
jgi:hypothetical protein